jgi:hypothetical protein
MLLISVSLITLYLHRQIPELYIALPAFQNSALYSPRYRIPLRPEDVIDIPLVLTLSAPVWQKKGLLLSDQHKNYANLLNENKKI